MLYEDEIAKLTLDASFHIHRELGPGLLESVYETVLAHELRKRGLTVQTQVNIPFKWDQITFDHGFRADIIIERKVIIEVKSVERIVAVHPKQLLTYLKLTKFNLGLLLNFNEELLKDGIKRVVNRL
ncbi:GxxExxY protein [Algoriphagus sp. D3-2-R+10]|uniref:GxxExxY protein n=1 Tax=Algoriphagus aurantiacus TaxID=3103948 RepID=UPI002B3CE029|nr:GxxExxY protein [Algoriphagus sp. D3-2-R+10]MEB2776933.1 GxxExxY protein [Algoriphagus sp. D3-2-R+10]